MIRGPTSSGSNQHVGSAEFSRQGSGVYAERARHNCERGSGLVLCCGQGDGPLGQFANHASPGDAAMCEVVHDSGSVDLVAMRERVDRVAVSVLLDQPLDLRLGQSVKYRV